MVEQKDVSSHHIKKTPKSQLTGELPPPPKKKNIETYQNRYPVFKDKGEATRHRRGAITIKSNPICTRWATHKLGNNYIIEVLPQE